MATLEYGKNYSIRFEISNSGPLGLFDLIPDDKKTPFTQHYSK